MISMDSIKRYIQSLSQNPKRVLLLLGIILLAAALPRIYLLRKVSERDFLHNDGEEYMELSKQLAHGNGFSLSVYRWYEPAPPGQENTLHTDLSRTPLFPLFGAVLYLLPWNPISSAKWVSLVVALFAVYSVFLLGKELAGTVCGLFSALLFSFYPYALYYTISWSTENLFLIFLILAFLFLIKACKTKISFFPYCALFLALASLTRPTALLLPIAFVAALIILPEKRKKSLREIGRQTGLFLLIFCLLMLPWTIRNYKAGGRFTPATYFGSYILWISSSDIIYESYRVMDTPEYQEKVTELWDRLHAERIAELRKIGAYDLVTASRYWKKWAWDYIRENPKKMLYILKERFFHYWRMCPNLIVLSTSQIVLMRVFFTFLFGFALAGLFLLRKRRETLILLGPPLYGLLISIPFVLVLRYRYPFFAPYVCVFAAFALTWLTGKFLNLSMIAETEAENPPES